MIECVVCEKKFNNTSGLHKHLKVHKLRVAEYYQKHFPRYDMYNNAIIKFKNKDQYFSNTVKKFVSKFASEKKLSYIIYRTKHGFHVIYLTPMSPAKWGEYFEAHKKSILQCNVPLGRIGRGRNPV